MSDLLEAIRDLPVIDSHEHLIPLAVRDRLASDFSYLFSNYLRPEFISAGATLAEVQRFYAADTDEEAKIDFFQTFWPRIRNMSFARAKLNAARDIFGVTSLNREGLRVLSRRIRESRKPNWYSELFDKARIETVIVNYFRSHHRLGWTEVEVGAERYRYTAGFDDFLWLASRGDIEVLESDFRAGIATLDDLLEVFEKAVAARITSSTPAIKTVAAYFRSLEIAASPSRSKAEQTFKKLLAVPSRPFDPSLFSQYTSWAKPLQDLLLARIFERAGHLGVPVQIHAGYQAGNGNVLRHGDPELLNAVFLRYPATRFELLHVGFPYHIKAVALAKMLPNVFVNFSWIFGLAPTAGVEALRLAAEILPGNRVVAFGGDYRLAEGAVAQLEITRRAIAEVLNSLIRDRGWTTDEAMEYAMAILYENPRRLYRLSKDRQNAIVPTA
jgi:hypothetical protein